MIESAPRKVNTVSKPLASWNDTAARQAIVEFVERSRVGRRPILAGGNSNGDIPMLQYTGGPSRRGLRLLLLHDDPQREFDYTAGAEKSLERANQEGWTVVSIKNDGPLSSPTRGNDRSRSLAAGVSVELARNQVNDWDDPSSLPGPLTVVGVLREDAVSKIPQPLPLGFVLHDFGAKW
jgi:hypothetical protein